MQNEKNCSCKNFKMSVEGNTTDTTEWNMYVTTPKPLENCQKCWEFKKKKKDSNAGFTAKNNSVLI